MIEDNDLQEKKEHNETQNKTKTVENILLGVLAVALALFSIIVINV